MSTKIVLTTVPVEDAERISEKLVEERAAACVNIVDVGLSVYFWEGKIVKEKERLLVIKTDGLALERTLDLIKRLHPYRIPEIVVLTPEFVNQDYDTWVKDYTSGG